MKVYKNFLKEKEIKHLEDLMFDQGWFDDKFKDINALFVLQSMGE